GCVVERAELDQGLRNPLPLSHRLVDRRVRLLLFRPTCSNIELDGCLRPGGQHGVPYDAGRHDAAITTPTMSHLRRQILSMSCRRSISSSQAWVGTGACACMVEPPF